MFIMHLFCVSHKEQNEQNFGVKMRKNEASKKPTWDEVNLGRTPVPRRTGYIICGAQYKMKMWLTLLKITKNFKAVTAEHETNHRALLSSGPAWLHRPYAHKAGLVLSLWLILKPLQVFKWWSNLIKVMS